MRERLEERKLESVSTRTAASVGISMECFARDDHHVWQGEVFVGMLDPDTCAPIADGETGEFVATALDDDVAPLVRYRSGELVRVSHRPAGAHVRQWTLGRRRDEFVVAGRAVLPLDVWGAIETVPRPPRGSSSSPADPGMWMYSRPRWVTTPQPPGAWPSSPDRVAASILEAVGIDPVQELVDETQLLAASAPGKLRRVAPA